MKQYWSEIRVLACSSIGYVISDLVPNNNITIALMDKYASALQLNFIIETGGIGGFFK